jgi:hypothetical protein
MYSHNLFIKMQLPCMADVQPGEYRVMWRTQGSLYCPIHLHARAISMTPLLGPHPSTQPLLLRDFDVDGGADGRNAFQYRPHSGLLHTAFLRDGSIRSTLQGVEGVEPRSVQQALDPLWDGVFFRTCHCMWPPGRELGWIPSDDLPDAWWEVEVSCVQGRFLPCAA